MFEAPFQPIRPLVILLIAVIGYGAPFLAGYFLGRYWELKKLKGLTDPMTPLVATWRAASRRLHLDRK